MMAFKRTYLLLIHHSLFPALAPMVLSPSLFYLNFIVVVCVIIITFVCNFGYFSTQGNSCCINF